MRKTTRLTVAALAATTVLAGCGSQVKGVAEPTGGAGGSGGAAGAEGDILVWKPGGPRPERPVIRLGDQTPPSDWKSVGAPFDNCTTLKWEDFPQQARPTKDKPPVLQVVRKGDPYKTACRFSNNESISFDAPTPPDPNNPAPPPPPRTTEQKPPGWSPIFELTVVWGTEFSVEGLGGTTVTLGGKPAAFKETESGGTAVKDPFCTVIVKLSNGSAGLQLRNGRFKTTMNTCETAKKLAETLASRVQ
ncbi:hypothetical protein [Allokutzneria albata]|uniref:DUF3558 domain-containing protein n=1 Tax=Allokutzneria albata TaxID=211114 RepID=A0A1G9QVY9_ALLAB|nr:hypothetical protein [Allokutzneria albata]SDM15186.1 hypothetical protein SAMN04489726_0039 [Allokutzneria albata]